MCSVRSYVERGSMLRMARASRKATDMSDEVKANERARSLVCAIGYHDRCDGGAPNGPAGVDTPCTCKCHFVDRLRDSMRRHKHILDRLAQS